MNLSIDIAILGGGYTGLILQNTLSKLGKESIIIERGYDHGNRGDDYVVFTKKKFGFSKDRIRVVVNNNSSGSLPFKNEYTKKVYNKVIDVKMFDEDDCATDDATYGYLISGENLLDKANVYGNIDITKIDIINKKMHGKVLHMNDDVVISYRKLITTVPIYKFAKLIGKNLFKSYGLFISYYPIGINIRTAEKFTPDMIIDYYSDPEIPFYRKQHFGNTIFYEYCINKPFKIRFDGVIRPGKFLVSHGLSRIRQDLEASGVFFAGRYALWDPGFLLDDLVTIELGGREGVYQEYFNNFYKDK